MSKAPTSSAVAFALPLVNVACGTGPGAAAAIAAVTPRDTLLLSSKQAKQVRKGAGGTARALGAGPAGVRAALAHPWMIPRARWRVLPRNRPAEGHPGSIWGYP